MMTNTLSSAQTKIQRLPYLSYEEQQRITRLCVRCALLLMQYGAESVVAVDLTKRLGHYAYYAIQWSLHYHCQKYRSSGHQCKYFGTNPKNCTRH